MKPRPGADRPDPHAAIGCRTPPASARSADSARHCTTSSRPGCPRWRVRRRPRPRRIGRCVHDERRGSRPGRGPRSWRAHRQLTPTPVPLARAREAGLEPVVVGERREALGELPAREQHAPHGRRQVVVHPARRHPAAVREGAHVAGEEVPERLVEEELQRHSARVGQGHDEAGEPAARAGDALAVPARWFGLCVSRPVGLVLRSGL